MKVTEISFPVRLYAPEHYYYVVHQRRDGDRAEAEAEAVCHVNQYRGEREGERPDGLHAQLSADGRVLSCRCGATLYGPMSEVSTGEHGLAHLVVLRLEAQQYRLFVEGLYRRAAVAYLSERRAHVADVHRFFELDLKDEAAREVDAKVQPLRRKQRNRGRDEDDAYAYKNFSCTG